MITQIQITSGLFPHMVLQRTTKNSSEARFAGTATPSGPILATVWRGRKIIPKFNRSVVGHSQNGKFAGVLTGIPTGGPYRIEIQINGAHSVVDDVLVGDVWLLGGQSNMQGCGHITPKSKLKPDPLVRAFYMNDQWRIAQDPIHNLWQAIDPVHTDIFGGRLDPPPPSWFGVGPGPAFGHAMKRLAAGVPQGLLACAHGGTTMTQWNPARKSEGGKSLYGAALRRVAKNGGRIAGIVWYQGESDAIEKDHLLYTARMKELIAAFRRDCRYRSLPVAIVQLSRVVGRTEDASAWDSIRDQQYRLPRSISNLTVVPAIDLRLDDTIHISGADQNRLGARLAEAMQTLRPGRRTTARPIELAGVSCRPLRGAIVIEVRFRNVVGQLRAPGSPMGFSLLAFGNVEHAFAVELNGSRALVRAQFPPNRLWDAALYYGHGTNPICNIIDEADRSLPAFGPLLLAPPRAITPFITSLDVSDFLPAPASWKSFSPPRLSMVRQFKHRSFQGPFCDLHNEISARGRKDEMVYFAKRFRCDEPMRLAVHLGYDAPVKVWINGKELFFDPTGRNPASLSKAISKFRTSQGNHQLIIALGTAQGKAWGIFLELERTDVPTRLINKGVGAFRMPQL